MVYLHTMPFTNQTPRDLLATILPEQQLSTASDILDEHAADKWLASRRPDVVAFAESTDDVCKVLRCANEHRIAVTTRGAGIGYVGGCVPVNGGIALSVARMNRIVAVDTRDWVAVVEPGVITGDLQDAARAEGCFYPPDPASLRECSIGGNIATNAGGPRCLKYGVTRPWVLGLEVVLADGRVLRTGGRLHKNKQGFDLIGNFVGSEGLLGVITEATLRLIPHPRARAMLSVSFAQFSEAAHAVQTILESGLLPSALEIADPFTLKAARDFAGEGMPSGGGHLLIEIDGSVDAVAADLASVEILAGKLGALEISTANTKEGCENIWDIRRAFSYSLKATGLTKLNQDIVVPRSRLVDLVEFVAELQARSGIAMACFGHAGDGNIHVNLMVDRIDEPARRAHADKTQDELFQQVLDWGGAVTGEHGIGIARMPWFEKAVGPVSADIHRSLKKALDPNGILNPGKFLNDW
jgi:glycolate oxidase subunit GlcD